MFYSSVLSLNHISVPHLISETIILIYLGTFLHGFRNSIFGFVHQFHFCLQYNNEMLVPFHLIYHRLLLLHQIQINL